MVGGVSVETLADLPPHRGGLLFVGLNPSPVSVRAGHYYQGQLGRTFWKRLTRAGILPAVPPLEADDALVAAGVGPLWQKIAIWRPAAVVFVYKRAASIVAGRPLSEPWGTLKDVAIAGRPCILMPGPYATTEQVDEGVNLLRNVASALTPG